MFYFLFRTRISLLHGIGIGIGRQTSTKSSQSCKLYFHMFSNDPSSSIFRVSNYVCQRWITTGSNQDSFTSSYLINKLGFSPQSALTASTLIYLKSPDNADTVISFFEKHGFSQSQIKEIVRKEPRMLKSDVEKTFLPKLEYLLSKGFSRPDLAKLISCVPTTLLSSLERRIIPLFNAYCNLIHSDEKTVIAIRRYPRLILYKADFISTTVLSNINILRDHGVPEFIIIKMLYRCPSTLLIYTSSFKEAVEEVKGIGFDPLIFKFVQAVCICTVNKSIRQKKVDAFKKWGWSDKEISECFRKHPFCFALSEGKIMAKMDFLVNKMGVEASRVANQPSVLRHSLEKWIVPRGLFAQHLLSKGLIKKDYNLSSLFDSSEENFLKMFITRHVAEAPELWKLYKANLKS